VGNEWDDSKNVSSTIKFINDMDVDDETEEILFNHLFSADLATLARDPRRHITDVPDTPEETELAKAKQQYLTHDPETGAAVRRTAGEDITIVQDAGADYDYTRVMGDILGGKKVLKVGMGGNAYKNSDDEAKRNTWRQIKIIQDLLVKGGWATGLFTSADGDFGGNTKKAVTNMQKAITGLTVDGVIGRQSAAALDPRKVDQAPNIPITGQEIEASVERALLDLPPAEAESEAIPQTEGVRRWGVLAGILKG
jgi:peptidoglycan hydrolase-like protein with peptidoglycan-binding domain